MIDPENVSAVLVTRGNVDMTEIVQTIHDAGVTDVVLWDNSQRIADWKCYGRYAGIGEARNDFIYHQDDDLIVPVADLLRCYDPVQDRYAIVANNRIDEEWPLTGIGAVFHRDLADFIRPPSPYLNVPEFLRVCDVVFAYSHPYRRVVLGYRDLPNASDPHSSMYLEDGHMAARLRARARTMELMRR